MQREVPELDFCTYGGSEKPSRISEHPESQIFFRYKRATRVAVGWLREEEGLLGGGGGLDRCIYPSPFARMAYRIDRSTTRDCFAHHARAQAGSACAVLSLFAPLSSRPSFPRSRLSDSRVGSSRRIVGGFPVRAMSGARLPRAPGMASARPLFTSRIRLESIGSFGTAEDSRIATRSRCVLRE
jgi:hypothetical protein